MKTYSMKKHIIELIKKETQFLMDMGYEMKIYNKICDSEFYIQVMEFASTSRIIPIYYNEYVDSKLIILHIYQKDGQDVFSFEDYMLHKHKSKELCRGRLEESDEEYIHRFFKLFKDALDDDLRDVLEGKTWIDVPPDWASIGR